MAAGTASISDEPTCMSDPVHIKLVFRDDYKAAMCFSASVSALSSYNGRDFGRPGFLGNPSSPDPGTDDQRSLCRRG